MNGLKKVIAGASLFLSGTIFLFSDNLDYTIFLSAGVKGTYESPIGCWGYLFWVLGIILIIWGIKNKD